MVYYRCTVRVLTSGHQGAMIRMRNWICGFGCIVFLTSV